jgi:hypothetical protein
MPIKWDGAVLYVIDWAGAQWRVLDVIYGAPDTDAGHTSDVELGHRDAAYRVFLSSTGVRRAFHFASGDSHALDASTLERQFETATYLAEDRFDVDADAP